MAKKRILKGIVTFKDSVEIQGDLIVDGDLVVKGKIINQETTKRKKVVFRKIEINSRWDLLKQLFKRGWQ